jgi:acetyl-CoA carboxylase biotin carboxyl carrier protein
MDFNQIQDLIKLVAKTGVSEVKIDQGDLKLTIKGEQKHTEPTVVYQTSNVAPAVASVATPSLAAAPATPAKEDVKTVVVEDSKLVTIKSPMIGTFYRSSSPDKPAFAQVGDSISKGQVVCLIEAMKLFNDIEAEISGKIVKVLVDDATPVEYDQPLFLVDPA